MSLYDAIVGELPFLRGEAESRMVDTFVIEVVTGSVYDPDPEVQGYVDTYEVLFTTPGYVAPSSGILSSSSEVGGRTALEARREVRIPWSSAAVPPDAVARCVAVGPLTPPRHLGARYRVGGSDGASQGTACHLEIVEVLS